MDKNNEYQEFKKICQLNKNISVDIEFQDLSLRSGFTGKKHILKSVSGKFCPGELTGILGVSGSGKTTLLNILSGYTSKRVSGNILINGRPKDKRVFHKISAYIMQDVALQEHLSVEELMMVAAQLKLSSRISLERKKLMVIEVLSLLGLSNSLKTWTEFLSGGERKRLTIALELVNNPPVIFLDEPTSGLDVVAIRQCMKVLKVLAGQGRTVICTIHQPSAATFQHFNQVYFLHDGSCIYNGTTANMVPFLSDCEYPCPITHSPADHILEVTQSIRESGSLFTERIRNGKVNRCDNKVISGLDDNLEIVYKHEGNIDIEFATSSWTQFKIILARMMLQIVRSKSILILLLILHLPCTVVAALMFYQIGNNASLAVLNFKFCLTVMIFFVYIYLMSSVVLFPREVRLLKREYINRWYGLKPYFLALSIRNLPIMIPFGLLYIAQMYFITGQPPELDRFIQFSVASFLLAIASEGFGTAIASVCDVTTGSIAASIAIAPLVLLSIYGMGNQGYVNQFIESLAYLSYLRLGLVAICLSLLNGRPPLECPDEDYCFYKDPTDMLRDARVLNGSYTVNVIGLVGFIILFRLLAFMLLRFRLTPEHSHLVSYYTTCFSRLFKD